MWDLAEDRDSVRLLETIHGANKPVALVCHAPGALRHVKAPDGKPLVQGKRVTGFTNTEEEAVGLTKVVPFLVEDELKAKGGIYSKAGDWQPYVLTDGLLITGQNPASSGPAAKALLQLLAKQIGRSGRSGGLFKTPEPGELGMGGAQVRGDMATEGARARGGRPEAGGRRHPGGGRRARQALLWRSWLAARRGLPVRQRLSRPPVHAARLGVLDPVRYEHQLGRTRLGPGPVPDRL